MSKRDMRQWAKQNFEPDDNPPPEWQTWLWRLVAIVIIVVIGWRVLAANAQADYRVQMLQCPGGTANLMFEQMPGFGAEGEAKAYADAELAKGTYNVAYVFERNGYDLNLVAVKERGTACYGSMFGDWGLP